MGENSRPECARDTSIPAPSPGAVRLTVAEAIRHALADPERALARRQQAPAHPEAAAAVPVPAGPKLTARELEVAQMIVRGLTNREIAAGLIVSPRTVDRHVENLLAKLGFRSRAQIAAWMTAHMGD